MRSNGIGWYSSLVLDNFGDDIGSKSSGDLSVPGVCGHR